MNTNGVEILSELVSVAFISTLEANSVEVGDYSHQQLIINSEDSKNRVVATLVLEGEEASGFLELFPRIDSTDTELLFDATELVNQIAGRLSNRLYEYGMTLKLAPPSVSKCQTFEAGKSFRDSCIFITTSSKSGWALKTVIGPTKLVESIRTEKTGAKSFSEGELLLFDKE